MGGGLRVGWGRGGGDCDPIGDHRSWSGTDGLAVNRRDPWTAPPGGTGDARRHLTDALIESAVICVIDPPWPPAPCHGPTRWRSYETQQVQSHHREKRDRRTDVDTDGKPVAKRKRTWFDGCGDGYDGHTLHPFTVFAR